MSVDYVLTGKFRTPDALVNRRKQEESGLYPFEQKHTFRGAKMRKWKQPNQRSSSNLDVFEEIVFWQLNVMTIIGPNKVHFDKQSHAGTYWGVFSSKEDLVLPHWKI